MDNYMDLDECKNLNLIKIHKMTFIYNAIEDGWTVKKKNDSYVFTKNHHGQKEVFLDSYLKTFITSKLNIDILEKK